MFAREQKKRRQQAYENLKKAVRYTSASSSVSEEELTQSDEQSVTQNKAEGKSKSMMPSRHKTVAIKALMIKK